VVDRIAEIVTALDNDGAEPTGDDATLNEQVGAVSVKLPVLIDEQLLPVVQRPNDSRYAELVAGLVEVRNQLIHLGARSDDDWLRPLDRLDAITTTFVENLGGDDRQIGNRFVKCLVLEAGGRRYALAQSDVMEVLPRPPGSFGARGEAGDRTIDYGGETLPVTDLGSVANGHNAGDDEPVIGDNRVSISSAIVVVDGRYGRFGLEIDRADGIEELVIQAMPPPLAGCDLFAGCGLLGNGAIALLFDAGALAEAAQARSPARRVLLIESSKFFRDLLTPLLESAGFTVTAYDRIHETPRADEAVDPFDVIVSDLTQLDDGGTEANAATRIGAYWPGVPRVALVASTEGRVEALGTGGDGPYFDAYVLKYDRDDLVGTLDRLITMDGVGGRLARTPTAE
jgi:CheY-like chemotaxis protein